MAVTRIDRGTLRPAQRRADGSLRADAAITRTGVFDYRNADGSLRREYRPDSEVFAPESLESFAGVPVTDDHPPALLTSKTAKKYACGATGDTVRKDGTHVNATLAVFDAATIAKMEAGKVYVSCGYECDLDETPGVSPEGERYDAVQRNIRGNHVAIVHSPRAGASARVRLDGAAEMTPTPDEDTTVEEIEKLKAEVATEKARADAAEGATAAAVARADAAEKLAKDNELALATAESAAVAATARADAAEKARTDAAEGATAAIAARVELMTSARAVLGPEFKMDGLSDRAIKCAVVKAVEKVDLVATRSDDYVTARYDAATERAGAAALALAGVRADGAAPWMKPAAGDAEGAPDEETARKKMEAESANAWRAGKKNTPAGSK